MFYYLSAENRIVLSHAMFWTMTQLQFFKGKIRKEKFFLPIPQYQEVMFDAFLQEIISPTSCITATSCTTCSP